jgi:dTDP-4-amino-4,6-dideoxy-D-galactose acyltransferase
MKFMEIKKLDWDSDFFNIKVGEIINPDTNSIVLKEDFDLIYVVSDEDLQLKVEGFENTFSETKVIFCKTIENKIQESDPIFKFDEVEINREQLYILAYESGKNSRFLLDKKFDESHFKKLYEAWIDNSINKKFADDILVYFQEDQIKGFVTYKIKNDAASVGLIAVNSASQGKGIGAKLLLYLENLIIEKEIKQIIIPTQLSNIQACSFYQKQGYSIKNKTYIKHYWKI